MSICVDVTLECIDNKIVMKQTSHPFAVFNKCTNEACALHAIISVC